MRGLWHKVFYGDWQYAQLFNSKKKASSRAFHPTPFSKNFTRTKSINPITNYIKQNYAKEAKKIAKQMRDDKRGIAAPNGKPSKLTVRQWLQVRTKAFKAWFGDWERREELTMVSNNASYADVLFKLQQDTGVIVNIDTNAEVYINSGQRAKMASPAARRKSKDNGFTDAQHNAVVLNIRNVFKHAMLIGSYNDVNNDPNIESIKRLATPIYVDGEKVLAFLTMKVSYQKIRKRGEKAQNTLTSRLYSVELDGIRKLDGQLRRLENLQQNTSASSSEETVAAFESKVKEYFDNVSKVVDENGEPLVVYHYTEKRFKAFWSSRSKDGLLCAITVELDGKTPGLLTSDLHTPSQTWQQHSRRPSKDKNITPDSNVKLENIEFDFFAKCETN